MEDEGEEEGLQERKKKRRSKHHCGKYAQTIRARYGDIEKRRINPATASFGF